MAEDTIKKTYLVRSALDSGSRRFRYDSQYAEGHVKNFVRTTMDSKIASFAQDTMLMYSDCFIMYAIGVLGVADIPTICLFLKALKAKNTELQIADTDTGTVKERLRVMMSAGITFRYRYSVVVEDSVPGGDKLGISLYSLSEDSYQILNQRLQKRVTVNMAIQTKPMKELIGWAAAAYAGSMIANETYNFDSYQSRVLRTKQLGVFYFPCELKMSGPDCMYYVAVMSSYLGINKAYQTEDDYNDWVAFKLNMVRNYINCRTEKGVAVVVVTVENNADLNSFVRYMVQAGMLGGISERVYFTGEGILNMESLSVEERFLQVVPSMKEAGYDIVQTNAPFLAN